MLLHTHDLATPTFVKLDVEGAEERAAQGMPHVAGRPPVLCELHQRDSRVPSLMQDLGYECRYIKAGAESNPEHWEPAHTAVPDAK